MTRDYRALTAYLAARAFMPFVWGDDANDCVSHAVGAVEAQTGVRPSLPVQWASEQEAQAALASLGGLEAAVDRILRPIPKAMAQRGDIAGVEINGRLCLMVVEATDLLGPDANGVRRLSRRRMVKAWSAL